MLAVFPKQTAIKTINFTVMENASESLMFIEDFFLCLCEVFKEICVSQTD